MNNAQWMLTGKMSRQSAASDRCRISLRAVQLAQFQQGLI